MFSEVDDANHWVPTHLAHGDLAKSHPENPALVLPAMLHH